MTDVKGFCRCNEDSKSVDFELSKGRRFCWAWPNQAKSLKRGTRTLPEVMRSNLPCGERAQERATWQGAVGSVGARASQRENQASVPKLQELDAANCESGGGP